MSKFETMTFTALSNPAALQIVKDFATEGILQQRGNYCYLKVDDEYIHKIQPAFAAYGSIVKPDYFSPPEDVGAHISVIYPEEGLAVRAGIGQKHRFSIDGLMKAKYGIQEFFALTVTAPSLAAFRQQRHLAPRPTFKGQTIVFHITVGVRSCFDMCFDT